MNRYGMPHRTETAAKSIQARVDMPDEVTAVHDSRLRRARPVGSPAPALSVAYGRAGARARSDGRRPTRYAHDGAMAEDFTPGAIIARALEIYRDNFAV